MDILVGYGRMDAQMSNLGRKDAFSMTYMVCGFGES